MFLRYYSLVRLYVGRLAYTCGRCGRQAIGRVGVVVRRVGAMVTESMAQKSGIELGPGFILAEPCVDNAWARVLGTRWV